VADLVEALNLPLVVVARRSLGTLNHTLLTVEVIRGRRLPLAGVVISETTPVAGLADRTNPAELRRRGVPVLAVLPHRPCVGAQREEDEIPEVEAVDWWTLARPGRVAREQSPVEPDGGQGTG
jgi:dethiobiotin synthetase